jgi:cardiolipin synthase
MLMLGQAFPEAAWLTDPIGWAFALWGAFVYWWAGAIYLLQTIRLVSIPRIEPSTESDTLGAEGGTR